MPTSSHLGWPRGPTRCRMLTNGRHPGFDGGAQAPPRRSRLRHGDFPMTIRFALAAATAPASRSVPRILPAGTSHATSRASSIHLRHSLSLYPGHEENANSRGSRSRAAIPGAILPARRRPLGRESPATGEGVGWRRCYRASRRRSSKGGVMATMGASSAGGVTAKRRPGCSGARDGRPNACSGEVPARPARRSAPGAPGT